MFYLIVDQVQIRKSLLKMIPFCQSTNSHKSLQYVTEAINSKRICGDNRFTKKCHTWFKNYLGVDCLLTTSCTHALEMAAILCEIKEGDEVIMPSYTFVSTANAFVMRGAKIIFVDIRPDTMNIDENLIEPAITKRTKAIVPVHYAGVACEMDKIMQLAKKYNLFVIEDAAQAMTSAYNGQKLGTIGDFGCFSFHETKNFSMGEGGLLIINNRKFIKRAEIIREKGTNRPQFFRGEIDKYSWIDIGSSYLPSDINAAYLYGQLEECKQIIEERLKIWDNYYKLLLTLKDSNDIELQTISTECKHNAHMFYIKVRDLKTRNNLIKFLREHKIYTVFHYIPLHTSSACKKFGKFSGDDIFTTKESERILRLPFYQNLEQEKINFTCNQIINFFRKK